MADVTTQNGTTNPFFLWNSIGKRTSRNDSQMGIRIWLVISIDKQAISVWLSDKSQVSEWIQLKPGNLKKAVKNCEGSGILPSPQANKLTCYSVMDAGRIYKTHVSDERDITSLNSK